VTETHLVATIVAFAFSKVINGSFSTIARKQALRISVSGAERLYSFLSVFLNHLSIVPCLALLRNAVLVALFSKVYISSRQFVIYLHGTLRIFFDLQLLSAAGVNRKSR